jgi:RNA polymerase sigma factor (sigma-70 family)
MTSLAHTTEVQRLFVEHAALVRHFVLSLLPDPHAASDVVQETFVTVTAKAAEFSTGTNFKAWVLTIARLKTYEVFRERKRHGRLLSPETAALLAGDLESASWLQSDEIRRALDQCLGRLGRRARPHARAPVPRRLEARRDRRRGRLAAGDGLHRAVPHPPVPARLHPPRRRP